MALALTQGRTGIAGAAAALITVWALLGGGVLLVVIGINVLSVVGGIVWKPFPGDFELTEIGVAVAAFAFLPYCQLTDSNVTADIFTARMRARTIAWFKLLGCVIALGFSVLLLRQMYEGMLNQKEYEYTTTILQVPLWWGFVPILMSLGLLAVASVLTVIETGRHAATGHPHV